MSVLPVTVIGGYLGAGKTTLLNHLLRERGTQRYAVLVNDFGDISIDSDLIESIDGNVMRLAGGCICCSFGSDLVEALMAMPKLEPRPDHVLIETSGVALPGAVARTLQLVPDMALEAIVVLADVLTLRAKAIDRYVGDTVQAQLRDADLIVLNKADLSNELAIAEITQWLAEIAPNARVVPADHAQVASELILAQASEITGHDRKRESTLPLQPSARMRRPAHAKAVFDSVSFEFAGDVDCPQLLLLLADPKAGLVRAKGVLRNREGNLCSIQLVGSRGDIAPYNTGSFETGKLVCIGLKGQLNRSYLDAAIKQAGGVASEPTALSKAPEIPARPKRFPTP